MDYEVNGKVFVSEEEVEALLEYCAARRLMRIEKDIEAQTETARGQLEKLQRDVDELKAKRRALKDEVRECRGDFDCRVSLGHHKGFAGYLKLRDGDYALIRVDRGEGF